MSSLSLTFFPLIHNLVVLVLLSALQEREDLTDLPLIHNLVVVLLARQVKVTYRIEGKSSQSK